MLIVLNTIWATSRQNQHSVFATSMDPDQPAHLRSLIRIHAVRLQTLLQVEKVIANSMDPHQTAQTRRLVWIHAGRKRTMLVLSWRGSYVTTNQERTTYGCCWKVWDTRWNIAYVHIERLHKRKYYYSSYIITYENPNNTFPLFLSIFE
jgi:hypothetical protein